MCSQADDPSQHVSDNPLRAALRAVLRDFDREPTEAYLNEAVRIFLAASATDEPPKHLAMDGMAEGLLNLLAEYDIYSPDDLEMAILSWKSRAASATDEPREQAQLGICPVCQNLFRTDGHAYDCPLAASATDEPWTDPKG